MSWGQGSTEGRDSTGQQAGVGPERREEGGVETYLLSTSSLGETLVLAKG